ncbi:hypothetical protein HNR02_000321 [Amycolatopsis endophytica]|uniref:Uncharacterized protein n=1 Tax=Amycolatopsis endophytica TaxID=860233 RepID=A0A853AWG8_9PSEU|nr:hypothetical protein [Amycolatopsis endophytica]
MVGREHQLVTLACFPSLRIVEHHTGVADDGVEVVRVQRVHRSPDARQVGQIQSQVAHPRTGCTDGVDRAAGLRGITAAEDDGHACGGQSAIAEVIPTSYSIRLWWRHGRTS